MDTKIVVALFSVLTILLSTYSYAAEEAWRIVGQEQLADTDELTVRSTSENHSFTFSLLFSDSEEAATLTFITNHPNLKYQSTLEFSFDSSDRVFIAHKKATEGGMVKFMLDTDFLVNSVISGSMTVNYEGIEFNLPVEGYRRSITSALLLTGNQEMIMRVLPNVFRVYNCEMEKTLMVMSFIGRFGGDTKDSVASAILTKAEKIHVFERKGFSKQAYIERVIANHDVIFSLSDSAIKKRHIVETVYQNAFLSCYNAGKTDASAQDSLKELEQNAIAEFSSSIEFMVTQRVKDGISVEDTMPLVDGLGKCYLAKLKGLISTESYIYYLERLGQNRGLTTSWIDTASKFSMSKSTQHQVRKSWGECIAEIQENYGEVISNQPD